MIRGVYRYMFIRRWPAKSLVAASALALLTVLVPSAVDASGDYTYDALGRLTTSLYDNGTCIAYAYDANGNRVSQSITASSGPESPTWGSGSWGCFHWTAQ